MASLVVLMAFAAVHLRAELGGVAASSLPAWASAVLWLAPLLGVVLACWAVARWAGHRLTRHGDLRGLFLNRRAQGLARWGLLVAHASGVLVADALGLVRMATGDAWVVDELAAVLPFMVALAGLAWVAYPVERRVREAELIRRLDDGRPLFDIPTRAGFTWRAVRHEQLLFAVPMVLLAGVGEGVGMLGGRVGVPVWALQVAGAAMVFALVPAAMVRILDTARLPGGELADDVGAVLREAGVGVRRVLVWRTGGEIANAAVLGVLGRLRYIVVTDALIASLPRASLLGAVAHEAGHIRRWHMAWLAASVVGAVLVAGGGMDLALVLAGARWPAVYRGDLPLLVAGSVSLIGALLVLGVVSRRLEWEADAFAARTLGRLLDPESGVRAMSGALRGVAEANGVSQRRFDWRHGSIAERRRRLAEQTEARPGGAAVDRRAGPMRLMIGVGLVLGVALTIAASWVAERRTGQGVTHAHVLAG